MTTTRPHRVARRPIGVASVFTARLSTCIGLRRRTMITIADTIATRDTIATTTDGITDERRSLGFIVT
jgi:hypothetical protein